ncbi:MAG: hypothetical protein PHG83_01850 [Patescibacteria group bacterium]|nr:hypothetical protein [Patescibacteria group bacterium]
MKISRKAITNKFLIKSFFIAILIIGASAMVVFAAWTEPTLYPPDGNASAPINIGTTSQSKEGDLSIGTITPISGNAFTGYTYNSGSYGVYGYSDTSRGVYGLTGASNGVGVYGESTGSNSYGVYGVSSSGTGIYGSTSSGYSGIFMGGNVGIGTAIPVYPLTVNGNVQIGSNLYLNSGTTKLIYSSGNEVSIKSLGGSGFISFYGNDGTNREMMRLTGANLGIGTTAPDTILDINGALTTRGMAAPATSPAGQGRIYFDSTANAFKVSENNGAYTNLVGGTNYWTQTATGNHIYNNNSGNVGIGTTATPLALLHVLGVSVVDGTSARRNLVLQDSATAAQGVGGGVSFGGKYAAAGSATQDFSNIWGIKENVNDNDYAGALLFGTRINGGVPTERMRISSAGYVGIGTSIPQRPLTVYSDSGLDVRSSTASYSVNLNYLYGNTIASLYAMAGAGVSNLALNPAGGNVGIGTTIPGYKFDVWDSGTTAMARINNNSATHYYTGLRLDREASEKWFMGMNATAGNDNLVFRRAGTTDDMVISTSGYVGIGTTAPISQLSVAIPYAKTDTTERDGISMVTNDASYPFKLNFSIIGAATTSNRAAILQTSDSGSAYGGNLILQPNTGNVGIGTTGPSANKLVIDGGGLTFQGGGSHYVTGLTPLGAGDPDTYAANKGYVDAIATGTGSVGLWRGSMTGNIYAANSGNVGIGTTVPLYKLDVSGDLYATSTNHAINGVSTGSGKYGIYGISDTGAARGVYGVTSSSTGSGVYGESTSGSGGYGLYGISNAGTAIHGTTTSGYAGIFMGGNVGIGTTGPTHLLEVKSYSSAIGLNVIKNGWSTQIGYDFTTTGTSYPRSLGLGIMSGNNYAADIPVAQSAWNGGYGGYIGLWADANGGVEAGSNVVGVVSIPRGAGSGSAFGFYSNLANAGGSYTKYGIYNTGETYDYFAGNVGIGTTNPVTKLYVNGTAQIDGQLNMNGASIIGVNKLTVSTIDPVYEIDGIKYATYVSDFAGGVRTETTGVIKIQNTKYEIDFDNLKTGSDLWLFWQSSSKNLDDTVVMLTPNFNGKVWYEKSGNQLTIYGDQFGEISYRLTAPRKDYQDWTNFVKD